MPPERGSPQDWLIHAESDLQLAVTGKSPKVLYETLCFHAQQAVEKALKAVLIANKIPSTKTHNIGTLIGMLPAHVELSEELKEAAELTTYAVMARYPGDLEPVTEDEYLEAIGLAKKVLNWAKHQVS
jgi:HEPN domain-containing protein